MLYTHIHNINSYIKVRIMVYYDQIWGKIRIFKSQFQLGKLMDKHISPHNKNFGLYIKPNKTTKPF